jgi:transcriptional regulator with XRE-family HTH domain
VQKLEQALATAIRTARMESGWSQAALARRLGVSQSMISRIETARTDCIDSDLASQALTTRGIRVTFDGRTLGLAGRREQRDIVHAACSAYVARRLRRAGWDVALEVEIGAGRSRGWIDILAYRASDRTLLMIEIKTEIHDAGSLLRTVGWYRREAWVAARRLGWRPTRLSSGLVLLASAANDESIRRQFDLLGEAFPGGAPELVRLVEAPAGTLPSAAIAMVDPRSRRSAWLRPTRLHGRRSAAPYASYRDAAERLIAARRR